MNKMFKWLTGRLLSIENPILNPVYAAVPLLTVAALAIICANFGTPHPAIAIAGRSATILALLFAIAVLLPCMLTYLITYLFADPKDLATRLLRENPAASEHIEIIVKHGTCDEPNLGLIVNAILQSPVLAREFVQRITLLPLLFAYVLMVFSGATMAITYWDYAGGDHRSDFGDLMFASSGLSGALRSFEHSMYINLETLSTVGFGDGVPHTLCARLTVDLEIVTTLFVLTFVVNVIGGLVMENSSWAWQGRRELLVVFIRDCVEDKLNLQRPSSSRPT